MTLEDPYSYSTKKKCGNENVSFTVKADDYVILSDTNIYGYSSSSSRLLEFVRN